MTTTCPKCQRTMERGYIPDMGHGVILQSAWTAGTPKVRRFFGGIAWRQKDNIPITTYRCTGCGFLESYAEPQ